MITRTMRARSLFVVTGASLALGVLGGLASPHKFFKQTNLVSDGTIPAAHTDANLVNAWGITPNPAGFWWVSDNGTGVSTLYDGSGNPQSLVVTIPTPSGDSDPAKVTGIVFSGSSDFVVTDGTNSGPARFIFATEDGIIAGWAPGVPPPAPSTEAQVAVDSSPAGAIYKGLAIGQATGHAHAARLYATDFHNGRVDVFDGSFHAVNKPSAFQDHHIPVGFAPFGIQNIDGKIFVTYAQQDDDAEDDVAGKGLGFVDVFDGNGRLLQRFASRGRLNAPWGIVKAPPGTGPLSNKILIGNFGDGRINVFGKNGNYRDTLRTGANQPLEIPGLWGLSFGNGAQAGPTTTLFFSAGPADESHGLFGKIEPVGGAGADDEDDGDDD